MVTRRPIIELYSSIVLLSFTGLFAQFIQWNPVVTVFWRGCIAGLVLWIILTFKKRKLKIHSKQDVLVIILLGVLMMIHWITYYLAVQLSTVAIGMISLYSYPVISALLEPVLSNERLRLSDLFAAACVFLGILIMTPQLSLSNHYFLGSLVGISSAVVMSFRNILSRSYVKTYSGEIVMTYQMAGSLALLPFLWVIDWSWNVSNATNIFLLAILCTAIAHTLWTRSLAHFKATSTGTISCLAPVIGSFLALFILNEPLNARVLLGGSIILVSALFETKKHA